MSSVANKTKVLLCGGGNAIHVLTSFIGSRKEKYDVSILSLFPGEAERLRNAIPKDSGIKCINDLGPDTYGKPVIVTDDPSVVVPTADIIIFALPSFTHGMYLQALKEHLKSGVILGAMPGEGGFDLTARHFLGDTIINNIDLFALETLPWACRIVEYGKVVEDLGTKKEIDIVVSPKMGGQVTPVVNVLQDIIGVNPILKPAANFLAVTMMNINSVWHPTISYGYYTKHDWTNGFDTPPLFYQGADEDTGIKLDKVSNEVLGLRKALEMKYPGLDLSDVHHVSEWMERSYGDDIGDKTNIYTMLISNKGYRGLTHPVYEKEVRCHEFSCYLFLLSSSCQSQN